jgi:Flp pilus assembly protein TadD
LVVFEALTKQSPTNPKYHGTYAALLANVGRFEEARFEAREAARIDPSFLRESEVFLESIRGKYLF